MQRKYSWAPWVLLNQERELESLDPLPVILFESDNEW